MGSGSGNCLGLMDPPYNTYLKPMTRSKGYISNLVQAQAYGYEKTFI